MNRKKKIIVFALTLAVIAAVTAAVPVLSYMFKRTDITNKLDPAIVTCKVWEDFDPDTGVKSSIKVENTGNIDAYLRVRLVSNWVDEDNCVIGKASLKPEIDYDTDNWIYDAASDTYYCKTKIVPTEKTPELLKTSYTLAEDTYTVLFPAIPVYQRLDVIAEAVQFIPNKAVEEMWPFVEVDSDNKLIAAPTPAPTP